MEGFLKQVRVTPSLVRIVQSYTFSLGGGSWKKPDICVVSIVCRDRSLMSDGELYMAMSNMLYELLVTSAVSTTFAMATFPDSLGLHSAKPI